MSEITDHIERIRKHLHADYAGMLREPEGALKYPYITPGSQAYSAVLWDWDAWTANVALKQILHERGDAEDYSRRGFGRTYDGLLIKIQTWCGFLALWSGIATPEQADRVVKENYREKRTFNAEYGVRTLSRLEKMYSVVASGCPSNWCGPIWGISNYLTFRGLVRYGYDEEAKELAEKTIRLFGRDFERFGALHEYYQPDNGEPVLNRGFQNWNYLVLNMINWLEGKPAVEEF